MPQPKSNPMKARPQHPPRYGSSVSARNGTKQPQPSGLPVYGRQRRSDGSNTGQRRQVRSRDRHMDLFTLPSLNTAMNILNAITSRTRHDTVRPSRATTRNH